MCDNCIVIGTIAYASGMSEEECAKLTEILRNGPFPSNPVSAYQLIKKACVEAKSGEEGV